MLELTTDLLVEIGGWPALKEARALLAAGRVREAGREGDVIRARVQGADKVHEARLVLAARVAGVEARCTCVESRRSGRVCAHVLAGGLAVLAGSTAPATSVEASRVAEPPLSSASIPVPRRPRRWRAGEENVPVGLPILSCSVLLPLALEESLGREKMRVILEARRQPDGPLQPWDALARERAGGYAVDEPDDLFLRALETATGQVAGINEVPRSALPALLRALNGHPHVSLGKRQAVEIVAATGRPALALRLMEDGALQLTAEPSAPSRREGPLPGWSFDGRRLSEQSTLPSGFTGNVRLIPRARIPDFLAREWAALERGWELISGPGFEKFLLETARPLIEARLEGALSGLTLELAARYGESVFPLTGAASPADETYRPDPRQLSRYWRRDAVAERQALAQAEAAGFTRSRGGGLALTRQNEVARFLANTLPIWRREWSVTFGSRLEETWRGIDVAEPHFALRGGAGNDWLSLDLGLAVGSKPIALEPGEIERWLETGQSHRHVGGRILLVPTAAWGEMRDTLADAAVRQEPGSIRVPRAQAPFLAGAFAAQGFRDLGTTPEEPAPDIATDLSLELRAHLRPYQLAGVAWLAGLAQRQLHGLLADDMGLGKTLQALAFAVWLRGRDGATREPMLVVCPTSLVVNWQREAGRFTPGLRTLDLTGPDRPRDRGAWGAADLLVTSYAILRRDLELYRAGGFSLVILDEAQHIKNRGSQNAQAARALKAQHRLVLTGTPLENSVLDLWSLYDFLLPGYLGTEADFRERYEAPLARGPAPRVMERLRHRVRPYFLRRTKEEVLTELPARLDHTSFCELGDEQREVYRALLAQGRREVFNRSGKAGQGRDRLAVLTTLLRLRQAACHLDLLPASEPPRAWDRPSAKLERTFELLDEAMDGGHRVLLFSQFVRALHLLRDEARRRGIAFCYLDGETVGRQDEVDRFQNDPAIPLFLISLKAGGTGLNLTGADTVIHFDPWWNPAVEEQATARAHRLGQTRRVQSYRLIAAGTVEEKIAALQARKRELFLATTETDEAFAGRLTTDDLEELLAE